MPLLCDWNTKIITVPKSELTLDTGTKYKITAVYWFELLRELNGSVEGIAETINSPLFNNTPPTSSTPRIVNVINGYTVQIEDGLYSLEIINGNTNFRDVEIKNQVSVGTNNTTGFIDPTFLEAGIYDGKVVVDFDNGVAGTGKTESGELIGTFAAPSNNIPDAIVIADRLKVKLLLLASDVSISEDLSKGYNLVGTSPFKVTTLNNIANLAGVSLTNITLQGELDGLSVLRDCSIRAVAKLSGFVEKCAFISSFSTNGDVVIMESYSNVEGAGYPIGTVAAGSTIELRDWHGSFGVDGIQSESHTLGGSGGRVIIGSTCIGGIIHIRGDWFEIIDNSGAGCTVLDERRIPNVWSKELSSYTNENSAGHILEMTRHLKRSVYVDPELVVNGDGSSGSPFNNIGDTIDFAEAHSLRELIALTEITIDRNLKNFIITGIGTPVINCGGFDLKGSEFRHCAMRGVYVNAIIVQESVLDNGFYLNGYFENCAINGNLTCVDGGAVLLKDCTGLSLHTISMNGTGSSTLRVGGHSGEVTLTDVNNAADSIFLGIREGKVTIDSTCVDGNITLSGNSHLIDNSAGSVIDTLALVEPLDLVEVLKLTGNKVIKVGDIITIYDDDGITVWKQFDLSDGDRVEV